MTAPRALRVSLAKAAEEELELALGVIGLTEKREPSAGIVDQIEDASLMVLLEAPGRGGAAAVLDTALVGAMVQQMTMGKVFDVPVNGTPRAPTRTDAALLQPWIDRVFKRAERMPDTPEDAWLLRGLRFGTYIAETRILALALDAPEYVHFAMTLDIAGGIRQGRIDIFLPAMEIGQSPINAADADQGPTTLEPVVYNLKASLQAALCRLHMPLSELSALKPGDTLKLPDNVLAESEILTVSGRKIAAAELGQRDGMRAIRMLVDGPSSDHPRRRASDVDTRMEPMLDAQLGSAASAVTEPMEAELDLPALPSPEIITPEDLPDIPDLPDLPDISGGDGLEDLPDLPDLPGVDDIGALPDLPDLPDVGDLPDLPDLPPLPGET